MKLLLDTHAFLWWLEDDPRLSLEARRAITAASSLVHVSAASVWEISIKAALGKLDLPGVDLLDEIPANGFLELAITARHARAAGALPRHHEDPFDRMLIAQAQLEGMTVVTRDGAFASYGVALIEL